MVARAAMAGRALGVARHGSTVPVVATLTIFIMAKSFWPPGLMSRNGQIISTAEPNALASIFAN